MGILQSNRTTSNTVASVIGMAASFIPYTKNLTNVSATGVKVMICPMKDGSPIGEPITITKFSDDKSPIQIEDVTYREADVTLGGNVVFNDVVPRVKVVLSVIPCTQDDVQLGKIAYFNDEVEMVISQVRQSSPASSVTGFGLGKAECKEYGVTFYSGLIISGTPSGESGQPQGSAESQGRWTSHSYTFLFTKWRMQQKSAPTPSLLSSLGKTISIG